MISLMEIINLQVAGKGGGTGVDYPKIENFVGSAANEGTRLNVNWTNPGIVEFQEVRVFIRDTDISGTKIDFLGTPEYQGTAESYSMDTAKDKIYFAKIYPVYLAAGEELVGTATTIQINTEDTVPPGAVTNFTGVIGNNQVAFTWTNPTAPDFEKVVLRYKTGDYPTGITDGTGAYEGTGEGCTVTGLENNTAYYFSIWALDGSGNSSAVAQATYTPMGNIYTHGVTNFKGYAGDTTITLSWTNPTDGAFRDVMIRRKTGAYPSGIGDGDLVYQGSLETVTDTGLVNDMEYYYRVFTFSNTNTYHDGTEGQTLKIAPSEVDDVTGAPGGKILLKGDLQAGYYGEVPASEFWTGNELTTECGLTAGTAENNNTNWLKFAWKGKTIYMTKKTIRKKVSWDDLNGKNLVTGSKTVTKDGITYKVMLPLTANDSYTGQRVPQPEDIRGSIINKLILPLCSEARDGSWYQKENVEDNLPDWETHFTKTDFGLEKGEAQIVLGQQTYTNENGAYTIVRNLLYDWSQVYPMKTSQSFYTAWYPVLEVVSE